MGADQPQRAAVAVALDLGDDADPPRLAVVRPDDAVFGRIILALARQRVEEMLDRPLAIVGMDAVDPILMGFVGGLRRQAMDDEIFRGAAVLEAVAEIDFDAADRADALDPRQLGLALLQRAMGAVALARDLLEMLPQPFGRCRLGQDVGRIGRGHTRAGNLCRAFSHRRARTLPASFAPCCRAAGNYRPCGTRPPARLPRSRTSDPVWLAPGNCGRPADDRCRDCR